MLVGQFARIIGQMFFSRSINQERERMRERERGRERRPTLSPVNPTGPCCPWGPGGPCKFVSTFNQRLHSIITHVGYHSSLHGHS